MLLGSKYLLYHWKPFYFPLHGATFVVKMHLLVGQQLNIWVAPIKTSKIFSANEKTAYSSVDSCFELLIKQFGTCATGQPQVVFGESRSTSSNLKAKFYKQETSETGWEVGVLRRWDHKKSISSPCQNLRTTGSLLQIWSQGLQNDIADGSLPKQSRPDCTQPVSALTGLLQGLSLLPFTVKSVLHHLDLSADRDQDEILQPLELKGRQPSPPQSRVYQKPEFGRGEDGMARLQSWPQPSNTCGLSVGVPFVPVWPTQPDRLTCEKCW